MRLINPDADYQVLVDTAAKELAVEGESNSYLAFCSGVEWCRKNCPPESRRMADYIRIVVKEPTVDPELTYTGELILEKFEDKQNKWSKDVLNK